MTLTPEQSQLLQTYMQKNRLLPQGTPAPSIQLSEQPNTGSGGGASLLSTIGSYFDTPAMQGPVQPGADPLPGAQQSWLSKFADRLDPIAAQQRQYLTQKAAPQINMQQLLSALMKAGI